MLNHINGQQTPSSPQVSMESQEQLDKQEADRNAWWNHKKSQVTQPAPLPVIVQQPPQAAPAPTPQKRPPE